MKCLLFLILGITIAFNHCQQSDHHSKTKQTIQTGASRINKYLPLIGNKQIAIVANHTSLINNTHLVDSLLAHDVNIQKIFSPEHGFRGTADAGELLDNHTDSATGLPVISLYGSKRKPSPKDIKGLDLVIFDIQDVGVRFYTYISTLHYIMESCAAQDIQVMILDRPNPNGFFIDGPILEKAFSSFVGMHPIPLVHGMTVGELAKMINGEKWLKDSLNCELTVIPCKNYTHSDTYRLPVNPSPNLPEMKSVYLYPSLGLFEGTIMSVGRGTSKPFQVFGHPAYPDTSFYFIPAPGKGAKTPKYNGRKCYGKSLITIPNEKLIETSRINLQWLIEAYQTHPSDNFFNNFFNLLAGNEILKKQIKSGKTEVEIRKSWEKDLQKFDQKRKTYLLYPDFTKAAGY